MGTWFESDVYRRARQQRLVPDRIYGIDLGMWSATAAVIPLTDYTPGSIDYDCPDHRIGRRSITSALRELQRAAHEALVDSTQILNRHHARQLL